MKRILDWLWYRRLDDLTGWRRWAAYVVRVLVASVHRFLQNDGGTRSGGLTYWTMMALVPVLAVMFSLAGAFGMKSQLEEFIRLYLDDYPQGAREFLQRVLELVEKVDVTALSAVAILGLLYTAFAVMARIEEAFNVTWQAPKARSIARRYADYVAMLFLIPILVLLSSGLTTILQLDWLEESWPLGAELLERGFGIVPLLLLWVAAALLLKVVPNARVRWIPAQIAGLFVAIAFVSMQWLFLELQIGVTQANAIYGTFAFLPLFLIYLNANWSVVILGAELCHAIQYRDVTLRPPQERRWTPERRRHLGVFLMREAGAHFRRGGALSISEAASRLDVPRERVREVARVLSRCELVHFVRGERWIVPGRPPGELAIGELLSCLDHEGEDLETRSTSPEDRALLERVRAALAAFDERI